MGGAHLKPTATNHQGDARPHIPAPSAVAALFPPLRTDASAARAPSHSPDWQKYPDGGKGPGQWSANKTQGGSRRAARRFSSVVGALGRVNLASWSSGKYEPCRGSARASHPRVSSSPLGQPPGGRSPSKRAPLLGRMWKLITARTPGAYCSKTSEGTTHSPPRPFLSLPLAPCPLLEVPTGTCAT